MKKTTFILFILMMLFSLQAFAAGRVMMKNGKMLRVDEGDFQHCIFQETGSKEEMDLWPSPKLKVPCDAYVGKKVKVTIQHEKIRVPQMYGTMDVLRLTQIEALP